MTCCHTLYQAVAALQRGEVIGLPTETLFGLAADPWHPRALTQLIRMKERPVTKGFILLIPGPESLQELTLPPCCLAQLLMEQFWPGPLTLALPARPDLPEPLTGATGFVAVRHSPAPQVQSLLALWQRPLISTSANRAGAPPPNTTREVQNIWQHEQLLVIDGTIQPNALPSTLLRVEQNHATLLRPGAIALPLLQQTIAPHGFSISNPNLL
ncbi:MAG: L-threonylcarbamoyladenylate synthase [Magnetococcales bacterium]|nr:L-threonylcarbamoyladenylate synthase [Magnetococcales bacterium]NGZ05550.1 L-threonylcarbamoyladenylate synthase [Magnetococcales bacterium]